jgi:hypothetical protein
MPDARARGREFSISDRPRYLNCRGKLVATVTNEHFVFVAGPHSLQMSSNYKCHVASGILTSYIFLHILWSHRPKQAKLFECVLCVCVLCLCCVCPVCVLCRCVLCVVACVVCVMCAVTTQRNTTHKTRTRTQTHTHTHTHTRTHTVTHTCVSCVCPVSCVSCVCVCCGLCCV